MLLQRCREPRLPSAEKPLLSLTRVQRPQRSSASRRQLRSCCSVQARWCIDIRYAVKVDAVNLLQEWVRDIGSRAGLSSNNSRIFSGLVGAPESRLELQVEFENLAALEAFWGSIPPELHKAWSQRMQNFIIDGSPRWELYISVPAAGPQASTSSSSSSQQGPAKSSSGSGTRVNMEALKPKGVVPPPMPDRLTANENGVVEVTGADADVILDWKGDPMTINPGDKLPFRF